MKTTITKIFLLGLIVLSIFNSCTKRIDINLETERVRLVVEGTITDIPGNQYVKLTTTAGYFSNTMPEGVSNAVINIENGGESVTLIESDSIKGYYNFPGSYLGVQGQTYKMEINLESAIGDNSNYSAETTMPQLSADIDSIQVAYNSRFEAWMIRLYAQDSPREDFYMFNGLRNGELITDSIHKVNISNDKLFNGAYTNGVAVMFLQDEELEPGDIFTLGLSNVTKEYASFVTEVQTEIQPNDPIFSGTPSNVSSNISNEAIGWFTAYPSSFSSTIVGERIDEIHP